MTDLLEAITATDRQLDCLGSAAPDAVDDELFARLLAWRDDVEAAPFGDLVDVDTAVATVAYSIGRRGSEFRSTIAAALLIVGVFMLLGLALAQLATWWWMIPASGILGAATSYLMAATMRPSTEWTTHEMLTGEVIE